MTFAAPWLLAGLGACAVPVILHWIGRARARQVHWALMSLLEASVKERRRATRIKDLLQLLLRILLIAALVLGASGPSVNADGTPWSALAPTRVVIALDVSCSMQAEHGGSRRFEAARRIALSLVHGCEQTGRQVAVAVFDESVEWLADSNPGASAVEALEAVECGYGATDYPAVVRLILEHREGEGQTPHAILLVTDAQVSAFSNPTLEHSEQLESLTRACPVHLVRVPTDPSSNATVGDLRCREGFAVVGEPSNIELRIDNHGAETRRRVACTVGGERLENTVDLPAESSTRVVFAHHFSREGFEVIEASLGSASGGIADALALDDERALVVRALDRVPVRIVGTAGEHLGAFLAALAVNSASREASVDSSADPTVVPASTELQHGLLTPLRVPVGELAEELGRLNPSDPPGIVVLAGQPVLDEALANALEGFVRAGGGLLVATGPGIDAVNYNERLHARGLLPAALKVDDVSRDAASRDVGLRISIHDLDHPIAEPLIEFAAWQRLLAWPLFRARTRLVSPHADGARTALAFDDGSPLLVEQRVGKGAVALWTSSLDMAWNDLAATDTIFVFDPILRWLLRSSTANPSLGVGESLEMGAARTATLADRAGDMLVAAESLNGRGERTLRFDSLERPGVAHLTVHDLDQDGTAREQPIAIVLNPNESNLTPLDEAGRLSWAAWVKGVQAVEADQEPDASVLDVAVSNTVTLTGPLLVLALALLALESLFARLRIPGGGSARG